MENLTEKKCVPCEGGVPPLNAEQLEKYRAQISIEWQVQDNRKIERLFKFENFDEAMIFVNKIADIARLDDHHPDIAIHWNKVTLTLWTHAIGGLSENDFIVASKIDLLV
jgi:4a-hydroxytetrahydrobiopterin dehydratase